MSLPGCLLGRPYALHLVDPGERFGCFQARFVAIDGRNIVPWKLLDHLVVFEYFRDPQERTPELTRPGTARELSLPTQPHEIGFSKLEETGHESESSKILKAFRVFCHGGSGSEPPIWISLVHLLVLRGEFGQHKASHSDFVTHFLQSCRA